MDVTAASMCWMLQSGLVLLMVGVMMLVAQRRTHRKLAVDLGGELEQVLLCICSLRCRLEETAGISDSGSVCSPYPVGRASLW